MKLAWQDELDRDQVDTFRRDPVWLWLMRNFRQHPSLRADQWKRLSGPDALVKLAELRGIHDVAELLFDLNGD